MFDKLTNLLIDIINFYEQPEKTVDEIIVDLSKYSKIASNSKKSLAANKRIIKSKKDSSLKASLLREYTKTEQLIERSLELLSQKLSEFIGYKEALASASKMEKEKIFFMALSQQQLKDVYECISNVKDSTKLPKIKILFLCTGNSCRSQIAEGLVNYYFKNYAVAYSAGIAPCIVNPYAIQTMAEIDIDISKQRSKHINELSNASFDYVISLSEDFAERSSFYFKKAKKHHMNIVDPATMPGSYDQAMKNFRKTRNLIKKRLVDFFDTKL